MAELDFDYEEAQGLSETFTDRLLGLHPNVAISAVAVVAATILAFIADHDRDAARQGMIQRMDASLPAILAKLNRERLNA